LTKRVAALLLTCKTLHHGEEHQKNQDTSAEFGRNRSTPEGLKMGSRGQGHGGLCPPPTDYVPSRFPDPEGVEPFAPPGPRRFLRAVSVGLTHSLGCWLATGARSRFSETLRVCIEQEDPGGEQKAQSTKQRAESEDQRLCILTPHFGLCNPRGRKRDMKPDCTPDWMRTSRRLSEKRDCGLSTTQTSCLLTNGTR